MALIDDHEPQTVAAVRRAEVERGSTLLLDVPPVRVVTELERTRLHALLGGLMDRRHVNDALYRAVTAMRVEHRLVPGAYAVAFAMEGFEIPIDLRPLEDPVDEGIRLVAYIKEPRRLTDVVFDLPSIQGRLADHLRSLTREHAERIMCDLSSDGQEFTIADRCDPDERFAHRFSNGRYRPNYLRVTSLLPEVEHG